MPGFAHYVIEYGAGRDATSWRPISPQIRAPVHDGVLCRWDVRGLPEGTYSVRVVVSDGRGGSLEARTAVDVVGVEPEPTQGVEPSDTPESTATSTAMPTAWASPSCTMTPLPVHTATLQPTAEPTPSAEATATPTSTLAPTATTPPPTATVVPTPSPTPAPAKAKK